VPSDANKRDLAANRFLRYRPTYSKSLTVSVAAPVLFVQPGIEVDGRYYQEVPLKK